MHCGTLHTHPVSVMLIIRPPITPGKNDKIHLESFYPFLAYLATLCHIDPRARKPQHFALHYKITNNVNPLAVPIKLPDGWEAKLVMVDDTTLLEHDPNDVDVRTWYPLAESQAVGSKLHRRIGFEGFVLPILTAVCVAILSEIYSTTSGKAPDGTDLPGRRTRLRYLSSPIADFGIGKGTVPVTPEDRLAYYRRSTGEIMRGQDPDDHYWLYFTTIRGEEVDLDVSMFTFNMSLLIATDPYIGPRSALLPYVHAFFRERVFRKNTPPLHNVKQRFSALRSDSFQKAVIQSSDGSRRCDEQVIYKWLREVGGREPTNIEKIVASSSAKLLCAELADNLRTRAWEHYPKEPVVHIEGDPGELSTLMN